MVSKNGGKSSSIENICVLIKKKKENFQFGVGLYNECLVFLLSVHETGDEVSSGEMSENLDCAAEPYRIIWLRRVVRWQDWRIYS